MKWLSDNWFKLSILVLLIVIITLSTSYFLKRNALDEQRQNDSASLACQKLAIQRKKEIATPGESVYIGSYQFKFNTTYKACFIAYEASYAGSAFSELIGHDAFVIENLTTGEEIFSKRVNPGKNYKETRDDFFSKREVYIGSATPI